MQMWAEITLFYTVALLRDFETCGVGRGGGGVWMDKV